MRALCERIGIPVNRRGYLKCPFHHEKTPSLKIYEGDGGWHCFGCGANGSVIDFAMKYYKLTFSQAIVRLNSDFMLGMPLGRQPSIRERRVAEAERLRREQAKQDWSAAWQEAYEAWKLAFDRWIALDRLLQDSAPRTMGEEFSDAYAYAAHRLPEIKYEVFCAEDELMEIEKQRGEWRERSA